MNNHIVISANDQAATAADPLGWLRGKAKLAARLESEGL